MTQELRVSEKEQPELKEAGQKTVSAKDLRRIYWTWCSMCQAIYSFERLQAPGFFSAMTTAIDRFYSDDDEERQAAIKRHMEFFNCEAWLIGPLIVGITLSMEEEKANGLPISGEDISGVKTGLMGPLAGVGDTLRQGTLIPIIGSISIALSVTGNFLGPILYMAATLAINHGISYGLFKSAYKKGKEGINDIFHSGRLEKLMTLATTVGAITIGGLAANTVKLSSSAEIGLGENSLVVQELLDQVALNILPLGIVFFTLYLLNKKISATVVLLILIALSVVAVLIGFV